MRNLKISPSSYSTLHSKIFRKFFLYFLATKDMREIRMVYHRNTWDPLCTQFLLNQRYKPGKKVSVALNNIAH